MIRVGLGYDLHRLTPGRPLVLGGVKVPFAEGLLGHSDADVLAHALMDALLGAAALGNVGEKFPDTEPKYAGADSLALVRRVVEDVTAAGYRIVNVDANLVAETPRLAPYVETMRANVAASLGVDTRAVSIKPKTNEGVGPEGRGEAISAQVLVVLEHVTE